MATYYRTGVETYSIIGTADEKGSLEGRIPDGSTYFAVDENMFYTFYDGTWYETLPEAARLYHDDVGTDTKPIKLVGGVATVVANELAEDSKVVHLAGMETITGFKTFTSSPSIERATPMLTLKNTLTDASNEGFEFWSKSLATASRKIAETKIITDVATATRGARTRHKVVAVSPDGTVIGDISVVATDGDTAYAWAPNYTADNSADNIIVTRSMLAQTPTVVHTTGNETIAGDKTFTGYVYVNKDFRWLRSSITITANTWGRLYELSRVASSAVIFHLYNDNLLSSMMNCKLLLSTSSASSGRVVSGRIFDSESRIATAKIAIRTEDNIAEIWIKAGSSNIALVGQCEHIRGSLTITPSPLDGEEPTVGEVYSTVTDIEVS